MWQCASLRHLSLAHNAIDEVSTLPDAAVCAPSLEQLDLSHNLLKSLPETIMQFVALRQLDLAANRLDLPGITAQRARYTRI